jgi:hypothetical protein
MMSDIQLQVTSQRHMPGYKHIMNVAFIINPQMLLKLLMLCHLEVAHTSVAI